MFFNISIDAGGLCVDQGYGNYVFTINLLCAISRYDRNNKYTAYTFCGSKPFQKKRLSYKVLPKSGFMKLRVSWEELTQRQDVFLGLNQALPFFSRGKMFAFSHGLSFLRYPGFYKKDFERLKIQLHVYLSKSGKIITTSEKVKDELINFAPASKNRIVALLPGIPYDFETYSERKRKKYLLFVGMNHRIKNVNKLVKCFQKLIRKNEYANFKLYLVGPFNRFQSETILVFPTITRQKLKVLYQEAALYVCMSHYESFNFPILEALSQRCPVVALKSAVISEMKKFVHVVNNEQEFIEFGITKTVNQVRVDYGGEVDVDELKKTFSWKSYITKLMKLYHEL
ncbi:hypothetical protein A3A93_04925 [Candidatus Roizmanbacteria bacterium RIFCSPLOWO2_01_FULL_38_12]|uniref:Glycosyl transferase family 1 domain-containing protein n=1 Tax=Candidatus Roizmanbacteria bacterium RIFCSPLOWO2_01_FULL_38_12 TaxID=1802061 RepID=A0A1F7J0P4_9BACT|nr:MAG: hypothetical protein A2861_03370 [Candidatus Roizmanbacteria bacterium RIFCSPHIGHO2_01_FULL_38_15]OGK36196.1 MAG: hypothetical protein A3F59_04480 [Candidatus Roizmanbacteria bacterium RIFCSPHIGHO2_12_FULL_38_13]OGK49179.1 MAG: hypothetical protein A3A93_04925 [Candidatus Roizmanbacteria bacterium RIFCSPLOWO2_01_FULL_38_12]